MPPCFSNLPRLLIAAVPVVASGACAQEWSTLEPRLGTGDPAPVNTEPAGTDSATPLVTPAPAPAEQTPFPPTEQPSNAPFPPDGAAGTEMVEALPVGVADAARVAVSIDAGRDDVTLELGDARAREPTPITARDAGKTPPAADDASPEGDASQVSSLPKVPMCGDGKIDPIGEACDDGGPTLQCSAECQPIQCDTANCACAVYEGSTYAFCTDASAWLVALERCEQQGMRLVRVEATSELEWLVARAAELGLGGTFWTGASDLRREGRWVWADGDRLLVPTTPLWRPDEPDNSGNCALVGTAQPDGVGLHDSSCAWWRNFVCEAYARRPSTPSSASSVLF